MLSHFACFAGCSAISGASAASWAFGSYCRGVGIFLRVVGEQGAHRLWEWDGAQLSLLAVRFHFVLFRIVV